MKKFLFRNLWGKLSVLAMLFLSFGLVFAQFNPSSLSGATTSSTAATMTGGTTMTSGTTQADLASTSLTTANVTAAVTDQMTTAGFTSGTVSSDLANLSAVQSASVISSAFSPAALNAPANVTATTNLASMSSMIPADLTTLSTTLAAGLTQAALASTLSSMSLPTTCAVASMSQAQQAALSALATSAGGLVALDKKIPASLTSLTDSQKVEVLASTSKLGSFQTLIASNPALQSLSQTEIASLATAVTKASPSKTDLAFLDSKLAVSPVQLSAIKDSVIASAQALNLSTAVPATLSADQKVALATSALQFGELSAAYVGNPALSKLSAGDLQTLTTKCSVTNTFSDNIAKTVDDNTKKVEVAGEKPAVKDIKKAALLVGNVTKKDPGNALTANEFNLISQAVRGLSYLSEGDVTLISPASTKDAAEFDWSIAPVNGMCPLGTIFLDKDGDNTAGADECLKSDGLAVTPNAVMTAKPFLGGSITGTSIAGESLAGDVVTTKNLNTAVANSGQYCLGTGSSMSCLSSWPIDNLGKSKNIQMGTNTISGNGVGGLSFSEKNSLSKDATTAKFTTLTGNLELTSNLGGGSGAALVLNPCTSNCSLMGTTLLMNRQETNASGAKAVPGLRIDTFPGDANGVGWSVLGEPNGHLYVGGKKSVTFLTGTDGGGDPTAWFAEDGTFTVKRNLGIGTSAASTAGGTSSPKLLIAAHSGYEIQFDNSGNEANIYSPSGNLYLLAGTGKSTILGADNTNNIMTVSKSLVQIGTDTVKTQLAVNGDISSSGTLNSKVNWFTAAFGSSDQRLKENIQPLNDALSKIKQLQGVSFDWKASGEKAIGFIAQDVEKIFPEAVKTDSSKEQMKAVSYDMIVAPLVEAVKQQQKQIESQQAEINELKASLSTLKK